MSDGDEEDLRGLKPDHPLGDGVDADFLRRYRPHHPKHSKGPPGEIAAAAGLDLDRVSKVRSGKGSAEDVFKVARAAHIAPPRRFLDSDQYRLLEGLERLRVALEARFKGDARKVRTMLDAFLVEFDERVDRDSDGHGGAGPLSEVGAGPK